MQDLMKRQTKSNGRWTKNEHLCFLQGLRIYGKNWKKIEQLLQTRSSSQVRSHAQKFFQKAKKGETFDMSIYNQERNDISAYADEEAQHSKMVSETQPQREDYSYFLSKIVTYTCSKKCLNFWIDLISYKETFVIEANSGIHKSFRVLQDQCVEQNQANIYSK